MIRIKSIRIHKPVGRPDFRGAKGAVVIENGRRVMALFWFRQESMRWERVG